MINIVIPMKDPSTSKQRLRSIFDQKQRHDLALSLFQQTLDFFNRHFTHYHLLVVTNSEQIAQLSKAQGASVLFEQEVGLNRAIEAAAQWSERFDFSSQLVIPADIAQLDVDEISQLLDSQTRFSQATTASVIICPSKDKGTNALLTTPPAIIDFCYGVNSAQKHQQKAMTKQLSCLQLYLEKLSIDVDFPEDLTALKNEIYFSQTLVRSA